MSLDIYAAKKDADGTYGPVVDLLHADPEIFTTDGRYSPNPHYIPGVVMNIANSNWMELLTLIGYDYQNIRESPMNEIRIACLTTLEGVTDIYFVHRLIELANICSLGIARGADHLVDV